MVEIKEWSRKRHIKLIQKRVSFIAIGPSTLRNQGSPGVAKTAQDFLASIDLHFFENVKNMTGYIEILDKLTKELSRKFPGNARHNWGAARKALNVFMEEVFYYKLLNSEYNLDKIGPFLEIPVDSYVVKSLEKEAEIKVPKWRGIKNLTYDDNSIWQEIASKAAAKKGIFRIYLDLEYWRS